MSLRVIRYVIAPRGFGVVASKAWVHVPGWALVVAQADEAAIVRAVLASAVIEATFGSVRRVINDLHDEAGDRKRGERWQPRFASHERRTVRLGAWIVGLVGIGVSAWIGIGPAICGVLLIALQLAYDHYAKPRGRRGGALVIATAYAVRALVPVLAGGLHSVDVAVLAAATAMFAAGEAHRWRRAESAFIAQHGLPEKAGAEYFASDDARAFERVTWLALGVIAASYGGWRVVDPVGLVLGPVVAALVLAAEQPRLRFIASATGAWPAIATAGLALAARDAQLGLVALALGCAMLVRRGRASCAPPADNDAYFRGKAKA